MTTDFCALCAELVRAWDVTSDFDYNDFGNSVKSIVNRARAALADGPAVPQDREPASVVQEPSDAELVGKLVEAANGCAALGWDHHAQRILRAAELLERQAPVPVSVSDALIKAECALSDIAEGEPMTDEGDPLKWAERRCAGTLAIIRPTMMQHKIRTSEWPPVAAHALPLPEVGE